MTILTLLAGFWFGPDLAALGDRDYPTRRDAHRRLERAGWLAYPALVSGGRNPEAADRCERLVARLPGPLALLHRQTDEAVAGLLRSADPVPELTPEAWLLLEGAVCRAAEAIAPVTVRHPDGSRCCTVESGRCGWWVRSPSFYAGDHAGEIRLLCESVRRQRATGH